jgi:hypothetical protein
MNHVWENMMHVLGKCAILALMLFSSVTIQADVVFSTQGIVPPDSFRNAGQNLKSTSSYGIMFTTNGGNGWTVNEFTFKTTNGSNSSGPLSVKVFSSNPSTFGAQTPVGSFVVDSFTLGSTVTASLGANAFNLNSNTNYYALFGTTTGDFDLAKPSTTSISRNTFLLSDSPSSSSFTNGTGWTSEAANLNYPAFSFQGVAAVPEPPGWMMALAASAFGALCFGAFKWRAGRVKPLEA